MRHVLAGILLVFAVYFTPLSYLWYWNNIELPRMKEAASGGVVYDRGEYTSLSPADAPAQYSFVVVESIADRRTETYYCQNGQGRRVYFHEGRCEGWHGFGHLTQFRMLPLLVAVLVWSWLVARHWIRSFAKRDLTSFLASRLERLGVVYSGVIFLAWALIELLGLWSE